MAEVLAPLIQVLVMIIELFKLAVLGSIIVTWLIHFGVLNTSNRAVYMIADALYRITEPVLRPLRNIMPNTGSLDLSPVLLFIILYLIEAYLPMILRGLA